MSSDVTAPRARTMAAANFRIASTVGSVDPAVRHMASVASCIPLLRPIAVNADRQYGQPLISETASAIWYRVSNGNAPPSSALDRSRKPCSEAGEWAIVLNEFGTPPYFCSTAASRAFALFPAVLGSTALIRCVLVI